jgi:Flp pilus assembly protein TadG
MARVRGEAQALVEFALAVSTFLLLVLGTFDVARAYLAYTVVTNAARETSRYAAAHLGQPGWASAAQQVGMNLAVGIDASALNLSVGRTQIDALPYVTVSGSFPFHSVTPLVGALLGDPITIEVTTSALAG